MSEIPIIGGAKKTVLPPPLLLVKCDRCYRALLAKPEHPPKADSDYRPAAARMLAKIGCNCGKYMEPRFFIIDLPFISNAGPLAIYGLLASIALPIDGKIKHVDIQDETACLDS